MTRTRLDFDKSGVTLYLPPREFEFFWTGFGDLRGDWVESDKFLDEPIRPYAEKLDKAIGRGFRQARQAGQLWYPKMSDKLVQSFADDGDEWAIGYLVAEDRERYARQEWEKIDSAPDTKSHFSPTEAIVRLTPAEFELLLRSATYGVETMPEGEFSIRLGLSPEKADALLKLVASAEQEAIANGNHWNA